MSSAQLPAQLLTQSSADWPTFGQNPANTGSGSSGPSTSNVKSLKPKWTFTTGGDVSARASVVGGVAYFPDWGGNIWAVNANTGQLPGTQAWTHQIADYFPGAQPGTIHSRTSPAVANGLVYIGTQEGAYLLAVNASNGNLVWKTQLESADPHAVISASPVVEQGVVYTGVASLAEGATVYGISNVATSNARGSVVAVDALSGHVLWKTYTVPNGYTGGGVWGSNLVVDVQRGTVFAGTGDNYSAPINNQYAKCISAGGTPAECISPNNYSDSIIALDMWSGKVKWGTQLMNWNQSNIVNGTDFFNLDCSYAAFGLGTGTGPQCPPNPGPDYDFGSAPNEITYSSGLTTQTIIGAGQKSGIYYALDPDSGNLLWQTQVGPGSSLGGMEWGSATDGTRIYVAIANFYGISYGRNGKIVAGSWSALDPATGNILWQVADPNGAMDLGPMAVANGVVYAGSTAGSATASTMLALDASTGKTLWSFAAGSSVVAGATIAENTVFWGSGYKHLPIPGFTGNNQFYAFTINGQ